MKPDSVDTIYRLANEAVTSCPDYLHPDGTVNVDALYDVVILAEGYDGGMTAMDVIQQFANDWRRDEGT